MKEFDYYIFIDYSVNLIGYMIIDNQKLKDFLPKISKFAHYREIKNKSSYIHSMKKVIIKENLTSYFVKYKIREMRQNIQIYTDIIEFLKKNNNCILFVSVDNHEYPNFIKLIRIYNENKTIIKKESELVKGMPEHQMSLVLDTLLNIERLKNVNK